MNRTTQISRLIARIGFILGPCVLSFYVYAQENPSLPRSNPEAEGVSSSGIAAFLEAAGRSNTEFHSLIFLRHGKVIAEGWWYPYRSDLKHTLYSTSKSFTSTAIGFALAEQRLRVTDKVTSFFPDQLPAEISPNLAALTVRDVLSMSDGQEPDPTGAVVSKDTNWTKRFLALPIIYRPGSRFLYNSLGTYMLSAILQKVTGQNELDYLRTRLFDPLHILGMDWERNLLGINTGGWGLRIKTEDMAKLGQLYLQKGRWEGKQILPAGWAEEATSLKIIQHPELPQSRRDSSDWEQGYCYQFWRCRHNGFRADGAFGQFIIVLPEQDAVVAITAETPNMQDELNLVWQYLLPAMHPGSLASDPGSDQALRKQLSGLALALPEKQSPPAFTDSLSGKLYRLRPNERGIESVSFRFQEGNCQVILKVQGKEYPFAFGPGSWILGKTDLVGPSLLSGAKEDFNFLIPLQVAGTFQWKDSHRLELKLRYIESPHSERITCHFDGSRVSLFIHNSFDYGKKDLELSGSLE